MIIDTTDNKITQWNFTSFISLSSIYEKIINLDYTTDQALFY